VIFGTPYSEEWRKTKTFCMGSLKTHGFGTMKSEADLKLQVQRIISRIESLPDGNIESSELKYLMEKAGACVIMKIVANMEYDFEDEEIKDLVASAKEFMRVILTNSLDLFFYANVYPWFVMWFINKRLGKKCKQSWENFRSFFMKIFKVS
jgi:hypothetical protein